MHSEDALNPTSRCFQNGVSTFWNRFKYSLKMSLLCIECVFVMHQNNLITFWKRFNYIVKTLSIQFHNDLVALWKRFKYALKMLLLCIKNHLIALWKQFNYAFVAHRICFRYASKIISLHFENGSIIPLLCIKN